MPLGKISLGVEYSVLTSVSTWVGATFFAFLLFARLMDLAKASILALVMAALIVPSISLLCRMVPWILLIMLGGSLEAMVYRAGSLNAKASSSGP